ncbi:MAG: hypothetical protein IKD00_00570 [Candidatus Methanomethylophilaceae archaeon]|nr:hypothetical protein [Candidatus Methanomethylophilaceae archaeon]
MLRILEEPSGKTRMRFNDNDLMFVMETIHDRHVRRRRIGRNELSQFTGMEESVIRGITGKLTELGFLDTTRGGSVLSPLGVDFIDALGVSLLHLKYTDSAFGIHQVTLRVRDMSDRVVFGVEQRDAALKSGGDGCTTIFYRNDQLLMPPNWNVDENTPELSEQIRRYDLRENDLILIGGSNIGLRQAGAAVNSAMLDLVGKRSNASP